MKQYSQKCELPAFRPSVTRRALLLSAAWLGGLWAAPAMAQQSPEALIGQLTAEVLDAVRALPGAPDRSIAAVLDIVDAKVMPNVDDVRLTSGAMGKFWRRASASQREDLRREFKELVLRSYSNVLAQVTDQTVKVLPNRSSGNPSYATVRTQVSGDGEAFRIDYRLILAAEGWKIYDMSVLGVWLGQLYRSTFAREINAVGIDGLILRLEEKNRANRGG